MSLTVLELKERMQERLDEVTILELLEIDATELCDRFIDKIEDRYDYLIEQMEEDEI